MGGSAEENKIDDDNEIVDDDDDEDDVEICIDEEEEDEEEIEVDGFSEEEEENGAKKEIPIYSGPGRSYVGINSPASHSSTSADAAASTHAASRDNAALVAASLNKSADFATPTDFLHPPENPSDTKQDANRIAPTLSTHSHAPTFNAATSTRISAAPLGMLPSFAIRGAWDAYAIQRRESRPAIDGLMDVDGVVTFRNVDV